ncbi:MCP four helix bundle domain-containing protein [Salegentibacter sp. HM20]
MKALYSLRPQKRTALVLLLFMLFVFFLGSSLLENNNLKKINKDISSLYEDRLLPAAQIYELSELLHEKRIIFEELNENNYQLSLADRENILRENENIEAILRKYEKTYLVEEEQYYLKDLKQNLAGYLETEILILHALETGDLALVDELIHGQARRAFNDSNADLHRLSQIQPEIGRELMTHYQNSFSFTNALYYLKISLTLIVGILILRMLGIAKLLSQQRQKFELN